MNLSSQCFGPAERSAGTVVNDLHSRLNLTAMKRVSRPASLVQLSEIVKAAACEELRVSIAGSRHAMGGQQFLQDGWLIDMTAVNRVLEFDAAAGTVRCEGGATWPQLLEQLEHLQAGSPRFWTFAQKQTGADHLTLGGAVSANIHGRGLKLRPFVQDVIAVDVVTSEGKLVRCSRHENVDLFRLVVGGYGLFGVLYAVTLRLVERQAVRRAVKITLADDLMDQFDAAIARGAVYGDFQYAIDPQSDDFLRRGVFSVYEPAPGVTPQSGQKSLQPENWERLMWLAHTDKNAVFREYSEGASCQGSEMITELYVPRQNLAAFLRSVRIFARRGGWNIIYGTIRLIERDGETFLAWAREPWACAIFNLCVQHSPHGLDDAKRAFRCLIDIAINYGGSYYLTYHKWATPDQVLACYPQLPEFMREKQRFDPEEIFVSNWYEALKGIR